MPKDARNRRNQLFLLALVVVGIGVFVLFNNIDRAMLRKTLDETITFVETRLHLYEVDAANDRIKSLTRLQDKAAALRTLGADLSSYYTKEDIDTLLSAPSSGAYPVGSIYQSTDPTSPAALFGGSWEEIASERVLMGASSTHAAGSTVKAGLPNLKGSFSGVASTAYPNLSNSGALSMNTNNGGLAGYEGGSYGSNCTVSFDASKSNAIYGRSSTVQPAAYYVHIWHRVA